jgi:hypothetical protein
MAGAEANSEAGSILLPAYFFAARRPWILFGAVASLRAGAGAEANSEAGSILLPAYFFAARRPWPFLFMAVSLRSPPGAGVSRSDRCVASLTTWANIRKIESR